MNGQALEVQTHRVANVVHRSAYRNILSNWLGFVVSAGTAFFLSPFVVRHLGNSAYGVWVLIGSLTGYLGLLDLGVRGAVTRYVASFHAVGNHEEAGRLASSALMMFASSGIVAFLVSLGLALFGVGLFRIPSSYRAVAQIILVIAGLNIAVSLVSGVFGGILVGLQRFDLSNLVQVVSGLLRAAAIIAVLLRGHGLIALAMVQLIFAIITGLVYAWVSLREYPELRVNIVNCDFQHLQLIFSFSIYAFLISISLRLVFYTDSIVIGYFMPVSMITFFAIAGNLLNYSRDLIGGISTIATPRVSAMHAAADVNGVRGVILKGAKLATMVTLPIAMTFILRGKTFIRLWMGPEYGELSGHVLWILALALIFLPIEAVAGSAIMGISKHKTVAKLFLVEALCNFVLSALLARRFGIVGVAWGTTLPSIAMDLLFWPWYVYRTLGISAWTFTVSTWLRPVFGIIPFAVMTYIAEKMWSVNHLATFFMQIAIILPLAAVAFWYVCFERPEREMYLQLLKI